MTLLATHSRQHFNCGTCSSQPPKPIPLPFTQTCSNASPLTPSGPSSLSSAPRSRTLVQSYPERSWHISIHHMHAGRSSLVVKSENIRAVEEQEPNVMYISAIVLTWSQYIASPQQRQSICPNDPVLYIDCQRRMVAWKLLFERRSAPLSQYLQGAIGSRFLLDDHKKALTPGSLIPQSPHFGAVPAFLMCRYRSFPPGVLMTRTLFDFVL